MSGGVKQSIERECVHASRKYYSVYVIITLSCSQCTPYGTMKCTVTILLAEKY